MADNKSIKFPTHHYVGFQARPSVDELPLGFMTPDGTDKAAIKRKATVDNWARGYGYGAQNQAEDKLPAQTYENKPMIGFKLGRNVRHGYGWGQGNVKWRIEDPRGFELEITSPNLAQIMAFSTIEKGEILEECIWARLGAENILVPVDSDVYKNTVRNTERMSKTASMRDIKIGDHAVLQNGDEGVYYGVFYIANIDKYGSNYSHKLSFSGKKRHVFLMQRPGDDGHESVKFFKAMSAPKLSELFEGTAMTHEEAEKEINRLIQKGVGLNEAGQTYHDAIGVSIDPITKDDFTMTEEAITYDELIKEAESMEGAEPHIQQGNLRYLLRYIVPGNVYADFRGHLVYVPIEEWEHKKDMMPGGKNHHPQYQTNPSHWLFNCIVMNPVSWKQGQLVAVTKQVAQPNHWYGGSRFRDEAVVESIDPAIEDLPPLKRFRMTAKTKTGCEVVYYR